MHDDIAQTQKTPTALKKKKVEKMHQIVAYMEAKGIDAFDVGDGFLRKYTSSKKAPVNKAVLLNTLKAMQKDVRQS